LNNRLNNESAMEAGGKWLNKGIFRRKVAERSELGAVTLKYVPYWVVPTSVVADFQGTKSSGVGSGTGMMMHGDGKQKAAGAALFALSIAAAAANQNRNVQVSQPQVVRVRDRIQLQRNIPVVAVRGYAQYQPEDGFTFELANKMNFDKRQTGGVDVQSGDISESEAKAQAAALAHKFAEREAKKRVDNLESIQVYPTTYDGELLHAADNLLRIQLANQMKSVRGDLEEIRDGMAMDGKVQGLQTIGNAIFTIEGLEAKIRHAEGGYSGLSATIQIKETELDKLYEYDYAMLDSLDRASAVLPMIREAADPKAFEAAVKSMRDAITSFESAWKSRTNAVTGIQVTAFVRDFQALSNDVIASRIDFTAASNAFGSAASRIIGRTAEARSRESSIA